MASREGLEIREIRQWWEEAFGGGGLGPGALAVLASLGSAARLPWTLERDLATIPRQPDLTRYLDWLVRSNSSTSPPALCCDDQARRCGQGEQRRPSRARLDDAVAKLRLEGLPERQLAELEAWWKRAGPKVSEGSVDALEAFVGMELPPSLRVYPLLLGSYLLLSSRLEF